MRALTRLLAVVVCTLVAYAAPALAQQRASVSGHVFDPEGLALPGATVTLVEQSTGFSRTVVSAETGGYSVPNLTPGVYSLTVEMEGFGAVKRADLALTAGAEMTIDMKMQMAGVMEAVTVMAEAPLVERNSNKIGGSLSGKEIDQVPSNFAISRR